MNSVMLWQTTGNHMEKRAPVISAVLFIWLIVFLE
jgi:hypothetical protein